MKRMAAFILTMLLLLGVLPIPGVARRESLAARGESYTLLKPADLTDTEINERGKLGFWGQGGIKRQDVQVITFLDSTATASGYLYDFSEKADRSILGWMVNGELFVAADGMIELNQTSSFLFAGMKNLTQINFNGVVDTSGVEYMDHMFQGCEKLEQIDLTDFDTTRAVDLSAMFYGCRELEELDVSGFDTQNVENMRHMFTACKKLESVDLSRFDTRHVTDMSNLFGGCNCLEQLELGNFDTGKTQNMNAMFANCQKLAYLDISGFSGENLSSTTKMFLNTNCLKTFYCNDETIIRAYRSR